MDDLDQSKQHPEPDTGEAWDGIRELTNDPPRWWMIGFYATPVFLVGYFLLYPAFPLLTDFTRGILGWSSVKEYKEGLAKIEALRKPFEDKIDSMEVQEILADPEMSKFAEASAKVLFGDNCSPCHGAGGQGTPGYPVLADDDWLYGGTIDVIQETITEGRSGAMPAYQEVLSKKEIDELVKYVKGLAEGRVYEPGEEVFMGETEGAADCTACHGEEAKGDPEFGSANLTDKIWRFSAEENEIRKTILHGVNNDEDPLSRKAVMPPWGKKLTKNQIKKLALKVYRLGGGKEG